MNETLKECLKRFDGKIESAVYDGKVNGRPFVGFADDAHKIACGVKLIIEMHQINEMILDGGDEPPLNVHEMDTLLTLCTASLSVLVERAEDLRGWADQRMKDGPR